VTLAPGQTVGGYQILEQIGRGGMATVFKAYQTGLQRFVAIKALPAFYAEDPAFRERFQNEAMAIARLRHPNILAVFDYGEVEGVPYIVTELATGGTLAALLGAPLNPTEALNLLRPIAAALDYSHSRGIIHRDIKPSNVLLDEDGKPLLADFGVAYILANTERLTATGFTVGTPAYMAPEQATGGQLSAATDVYALAVMLYEMLTGAVPFSGDSPLTIAIAHMHTPPPPPRTRTPSITDAVQNVVLTGLAKQSAERFQTAGALVAALESAANAQDTPSVADATTIAAPLQGATEPMPTVPPEPESRRRYAMVPQIAVVVLIATSIAGFVLAGRDGSDAATGRTPTAVPAPLASVPAVVAAPTAPASSVALAPEGVWQVFGGAQRFFNQPSSVAMDALGSVFVLDTFGHQLWKLSSGGQELARWGSQGSDAGQFRTPSGVAVDRQGNVYVADTSNNRVQIFAADGRFVAQWGGEGNRPGQFAQPYGLAVDAGGSIYVSDTGNNRIQVLSNLGQPVAQWGRQGTGPVQFSGPRGLAVDAQGNVYVADTNNHRIQKLSRDGQSLAMWGGEGDGPAQFRFPQAVALDTQGRIYVADSRNHRVQRLTPQGAYSAAWGSPGSAPGQFASPQGLTVDQQGVLYVADTDNNRVQRINLGST
jgi:sugar lactone lactonase YvrE/tRNA A-37 threonylcarbamoyl transferase component Bud32